MQNDNSDTLSAGQPLYRCAGCGRPLRLPPGIDATAGLVVCAGCRPYLEGDVRLHRLAQQCEARGLTLWSAVETARTLQAARYGKRGG
jgi:hypothetical protein